MTGVNFVRGTLRDERNFRLFRRWGGTARFMSRPIECQYDIIGIHQFFSEALACVRMVRQAEGSFQSIPMYACRFDKKTLSRLVGSLLIKAALRAPRQVTGGSQGRASGVPVALEPSGTGRRGAEQLYFTGLCGDNREFPRYRSCLEYSDRDILGSADVSCHTVEVAGNLTAGYDDKCSSSPN